MLELICHNSRQKKYRTPFGAAVAGQTIRLAIDVPEESIETKLRLWMDGAEHIMEGRREGSSVSFCFQCGHTGLVWYYFLLFTKEGKRYYGGSGGEGRLYDTPPPAYQITVYDPAFQTPAWFQNGIAYQIFPDRFSRSGTRGGLDRAGAHTALGRKVYLHESWEEPVLSEPIDGEKNYAPCDFYGGDLRGIEEKLPYLEELGVTCIYLNPVFESPSNHRYNTSDYLKIDPILGDESDLRRLAAKAREHGIRLMFDGVFSHTGDDSVYFDRRNVYGNGACHDPASPYCRWYDEKGTGEHCYWWGFESLPEVNELEPSYMAFVHTVLEHWALCGVTSWRLDVADELPDEFIGFLRQKLKALDPSAVLLGEVWEDASNKVGYGARRKFVDGHELDSAMGYPFREAVFDFLLGRTNARGLSDRLSGIRENYPKPFYDAQLNLIGSHDTVRALTALSGAPHRDALTRGEQARYRPQEEQLSRGRARLVLAAALQMAVPGVPCIYYGDEAGATGMADPFCRAAYPWGREDETIRGSYRALTNARKESAALKAGACGFAAVGEDVFAVLRTNGEESALACINRAEAPVEITLSLDNFSEGPDAGTLRFALCYRDALGGNNVNVENGVIKLRLPPLSGVLLLQSK